MERFIGMSFEQAMLHVACYDKYLKYQEDPDCDTEDWFDVQTSLRRAKLFESYVNTILYGTGRQQAIFFNETFHRRFEQTPFPFTIEHGTKDWFVEMGVAFMALKQGSGWFSSRYATHDQMLRWLDSVDSDTFTAQINEAINDGDTKLSICDDCGEYARVVNETFNDEYVCQNCIENNYAYDDYHEYWFRSHNAVDAIGPDGQHWIINNDDTDDFRWDDYNERYVHDDYEDDDRVIRGYHSNGDNYRQVESAWTKANKRYFGVELEVECQADREDSAQEIYNWFANNRPAAEQLYYEEDGSLSDGFEMISHPMGLDKHREIWKWVEQKHLIRNLRSHNTSTCGLHVHVSKAGLTTLTISKAVCFVNNPSNKPLIKAIARRYSSGYCRAKHVTLADGAKRGDKYEMMNLNKQHTIEFRIFRGSLNYNAIQASLEFTNAVLNFAAETSMEELNELKFLQFLYKPEQRMDTKFLRAYLEQRSARIKDIVDKQIKPLYKLRVIKPQPVETTADEPAQTPPSRERGSSRCNVSYPEDIPPSDPNSRPQIPSRLSEMVREHRHQIASEMDNSITNATTIHNPNPWTTIDELVNDLVTQSRAA